MRDYVPWINKVCGYGLRLDALPVNGEIVLFPPREKDEDQNDEDVLANHSFI